VGLRGLEVLPDGLETEPHNRQAHALFLCGWDLIAPHFAESSIGEVNIESMIWVNILQNMTKSRIASKVLISPKHSFFFDFRKNEKRHA
jgi:hypothetical protein